MNAASSVRNLLSSHSRRLTGAVLEGSWPRVGKTQEIHFSFVCKHRLDKLSECSSCAWRAFPMLCPSLWWPLKPQASMEGAGHDTSIDPDHWAVDGWNEGHHLTRDQPVLWLTSGQPGAFPYKFELRDIESSTEGPGRCACRRWCHQHPMRVPSSFTSTRSRRLRGHASVLSIKLMTLEVSLAMMSWFSG